MRFLNFTIQILLSLAFLIAVSEGCKTKPRILKSPPHYNFSQPFTDKLDPKLQEISGIAWDPKNNVFMAIDDGSNKLFFLDKDTRIINGEFVFGAVGDYEDVALHNGIPYILRSDGMITKFVKDSAGKVHGLDVGTVALTGKNDFKQCTAILPAMPWYLFVKIAKQMTTNQLALLQF